MQDENEAGTDRMGEGAAAITVLVWGTIDLGKPRARIMLDAMEHAGIRVERMTAEIWGGVEDKASLRGPGTLGRAVRYIGAMIRLVRAYRSAPAHDVLLVGYLGQFDMLFTRLLRRRAGRPIVWDAFLSLFDTVVVDRAMVRTGGIAARLLRRLEATAARGADVVVLDTDAHAARFRALLELSEQTFASVPVGVEPGAFPALPPKVRIDGACLRILFYGQFIPLHGIATIIEAARRSAGRGWQWHIIGDGQEARPIAADLARRPVENLTWDRWVNYERLTREIALADVCLGVFGTSGKAASVVPNKVYQVLASGRPLVTRASPAMEALAPEGARGLCLVPPGDPDAIVAAIADLEIALRDGLEPDYEALRAQFTREALGKAWRDIFAGALRNQ